MIKVVVYIYMYIYIQSINTTNHIRKKQLHVSALLLGHRQFVQDLWGNYIISIGYYVLCSLLTSPVQPDNGPVTRPKHVVFCYMISCVDWKYMYIYTGCPRKNVKYFRRVFLMLNYTDITQNTYIQSWTVTEIMAREKCGHLAFPRTVPLQLLGH